MRYKVSLKKTEEGYAIWVPGLPGCWSQGETEEEALENIKDAIEGYLKTNEESRLWQEAAMKHFLEAYSDSDAIYDDL